MFPKPKTNICICLNPKKEILMGSLLRHIIAVIVFWLAQPGGHAHREV
jgi:hypothetical protein